MNSTEKLYKYLNLKLQKPVNYNDLNNLCFSLFCTLDILPENLQSLIITKKNLAKTFIKIITENDVYNNSIENTSEFNGFDVILNENDWIEQIDKSMRMDKWPNIENAKILLGTNVI
ncbi:hypothetical protein HSX10_18445 [Winogradskyella undariae]|uniref:hypothetical protein n=1 Tax=Winogradskyella undariae TaxID=1285465 RepID=UPI00156BB92B|nr:hypothetical protein [Winogradskyella undariae]NRR93557.1 hypothetical protein [Winogradskyella undariae]